MDELGSDLNRFNRMFAYNLTKKDFIMKKLPKFLTLATWVFRQSTTEFLMSLEDYQASLARVYHSELFHGNVAVLHIDGHSWKLHILISELVERTDLLEHMHPLEVELVRLLAEEEYPDFTFSSERSLSHKARSGLERFACIDRHYVSHERGTSMVVITDPVNFEQKCLSIKELINQRTLLKSIKHLSSVPDTNKNYAYLSDKVALC